jgi:hypothetical protein
MGFYHMGDDCCSCDHSLPEDCDEVIFEVVTSLIRLIVSNKKRDGQLYKVRFSKDLIKEWERMSKEKWAELDWMARARYSEMFKKLRGRRND